MPDTTFALSRKVWRQGRVSEDSDQVVEESPVALVYNGISHAVMMATPADLADLALDRTCQCDSSLHPCRNK